MANNRYNTSEWTEKIKNACENEPSMHAAAAKLGMNFKTLRGYAIKLGVFKTNQGGYGTTKKKKTGVTPLSEILEGKHPSYPTLKLKYKLLDAGLKEWKCECCGITNWLGQRIALELDHIDGNRYNHKLENLRILCPNCHSQTPTFRFKKRNSSVAQPVDATDLKSVQ